MKLALVCYERALALEPEQPTYLFNRSIVLAAFGRFEEALKDLQRAAQTEPCIGEAARDVAAFDPLRADPRFRALGEA